MAMELYDIVVVGAGPAGSSAAEAAASAGARVLVVERKHNIGRPVRCAEYIPARLLGEVSAGRGFVSQRVEGMETFLSGGLIQRTRAPGLILERDLFDSALVEKAVGAGAELLTGASAVGLEGGLLTVRTRSGRVSTVAGSIIIGADGPHSRVGRWIGVRNTGLIPGIQARARLVKKLSFTQVHFFREIHCGYGWVFPKNDQANVGLGMKPLPGGSSLNEALDSFLETLTKEGVIRSASRARTAGWIPAGPVRSFTSGNVLLAGDAAGHTNPVTGAGVAQAVLGGRMAGKHAAMGVAAKNPETGARNYENEWMDMFGESHERAWNRRLLLEDRWDDLDSVIRRCWVAFREYYAGS